MQVTKRKILKISSIIVLSVLLLLVTVFSIVYFKKNSIVNTLVDQMNSEFAGEVVIGQSILSPFENFPYVSIDLQDLEIHETKSISSDTILFVKDAYIGFDVLSLLGGNVDIKKIKLQNGFLNIIQDNDGEFNITKAFATKSTQNSVEKSESFQLDLKEIDLIDFDITKLNSSNNLLIETYITYATAQLKKTDYNIIASLETQALFSIFKEDKTSILQNKNFNFKTSVDHNLRDQLLTISPTELLVEEAIFLSEGTIDFNNNFDLDLKFKGEKPDFDLFLAFIPKEYAPILKRYNNGGKVYFESTINGPSTNGFNPHIDVYFGCSEAFVENTVEEVGIDDLFFKGHFTNGEKNNLTTMRLSIEDFAASPETGSFKANIEVNNFEAPDIKMEVDSELNVNFLTDFFNIQGLEDVSGSIALKMNFHDIIDIDDPTKAIEKLNESYFTELKVKDLKFTSPDLTFPVENLNIYAYMDGHKAIIDNFSLKTGQSDIALKGNISDLPAILHHTDIPVNFQLDISSNQIDLAEITRTKTDSILSKEKINNLKLDIEFNTTAKAVTESPYLPLGEFFINSLNADLSNYPHSLHDFRADVLVDSTDFRVIDFVGMIDQSDFHFDGKLFNYDVWFQDNPKGTTQIDFNFTSKTLQLQDLFSYNGENYVPEDYREEEFSNVFIHGISEILFDKKIKRIKTNIDKIEAKMKVHKMHLEKFKAQILWDTTLIKVDDFSGIIGNSDISGHMTFYNDSLRSKTEKNKISLHSNSLDFNQLFSYVPEEAESKSHEEAFNIFDLPFSDMDFDVEIKDLNYHKIRINNLGLKGRMQKNHFVYLDTLSMNTAGGSLAMNGYFNGSDPENIYFSPNAKINAINLDKVLLKFDNFGQDNLISDNLHGNLSGTVYGKIKMHPDLIPITSDSELTMDVEIHDGSLENFELFNVMSDYFKDKNLNLVRFDTLKNTLILKDGNLIIPSMNINSSLGYFEISGRQGFDLSMDYNIRIPIKVIAKAGFQKLFRKKEDTSEQIDSIQYRDYGNNTKFINIKVSGNSDNYNIKMGKSKEK